MKTSLCRPARSKENLVALLNRLASACDKDARRFERAAHEVSNEELSMLFSRYARRRSELARELGEQIARIEGRAPLGAAVVRVPRQRARLSLSLARRRDDATVLNECEQAEAALRAMYDAALQESLPGDLPMCLRRQSLAIVDAHDQIRNLCDALAWCAVPMAV